jgi:hypothetical protein
LGAPLFYVLPFVLQLVKKSGLTFCMEGCCCPSVNFGDIRKPLYGACAFQGAKVRGYSPQLTVSLCSDIFGEE